MTQHVMTITTLKCTVPVIHTDKQALKDHFETYAFGRVVDLNNKDISLEGIRAVREEVSLWADELFRTGKCESDGHYPYLSATLALFEI